MKIKLIERDIIEVIRNKRSGIRVRVIKYKDQATKPVTCEECSLFHPNSLCNIETKSYFCVKLQQTIFKNEATILIKCDK